VKDPRSASLAQLRREMRPFGFGKVSGVWTWRATLVLQITSNHDSMRFAVWWCLMIPIAVTMFLGRRIQPASRQYQPYQTSILWVPTRKTLANPMRAVFNFGFYTSCPNNISPSKC
jgi:hypothetical protein